MPRYQNQLPDRLPSLREVLRWKRTAQPTPWPQWVEVTPGQPPARAATRGRIALTVVNHSTVLIGADERFFLTDPIWSERCSPVPWAGPRRVHAPGLRIEELPALDGILLSHNHYDHCDAPTLRRLAAAQPGVAVYTGAGNEGLLRRLGFAHVHAMQWWENATTPGGRVHYTPSQHFSARGLFDRFRSLWGGFVLETGVGRVFFAGDTAVGPHDAQLAERFPDFRVALLPIGAYEPRWFMRHSHMNPAEAVATHRTIRAAQSVAIHYGTFAGLTDEGRDDPVHALVAAREAAGLPPEAFLTPAFGETLWFEPR